MSSRYFLLSRVFLKQLFFVLLFLLVVLFGSIYGLKMYTLHGKSTPLPNFKGLSFDSVQAYCESNHLKWVLIDSVYVADLEPHSVIEHVPDSGFQVKKNRTVYFTINSAEPDQIVMPNLIDLSFRQAKAVLERQNLVVGTISYQPDLAVGTVLKQFWKEEEIVPGDAIPSGATIDLVLGSGLSNESIPVPDFIGLKLEEVQELTDRLYLRLGLVHEDSIFDENLTDSVFAFTWKQFPEAIDGKLIRLGSSIDIWLTTDSLKLPVDTINQAILDSINGEAFYQDVVESPETNP